MPQALIIGGSLGGLLAANLLRSIGWSVQVFERVGDDLASRGAGIGTHDELLEIMQRVGITVDASIGVNPESRTCLDRTGRVQHTMPRPRILSSWGRLYLTPWYHPLSDAGLAALCTDASGYCHGTAIAPALIRPDAIADMRACARHALAPQCVQVIDLTEQPFFQAIFDLAPPTMVHRRAVLLGDAAFVARPHVGMGVTKAALDAESLADALLDIADIDAALARFNRQQHLFGTRVVARARHVGTHLGARATKPPATWTEAERHQDPVRMMRESGARLRDVPELIEVVRANRGARGEAWSAARQATPVQA